MIRPILFIFILIQVAAPVSASYMIILSSTVGLWSGLSWLPTVVGVSSRTFYILSCIDKGTVYVNVPRIHAGQNHVHFQRKRVPFSQQFCYDYSFLLWTLDTAIRRGLGFLQMFLMCISRFLNGTVGGGIQLGPLGTAATNKPSRSLLARYEKVPDYTSWLCSTSEAADWGHRSSIQFALANQGLRTLSKNNVKYRECSVQLLTSVSNLKHCRPQQRPKHWAEPNVNSLGVGVL
jgi:hypothetical protein